MQVMVPLKMELNMTVVLAAIGMMDAIKQERPSLKIWETETPCGNGRATQVSGRRIIPSMSQHMWLVSVRHWTRHEKQQLGMG